MTDAGAQGVEMDFDIAEVEWVGVLSRDPNGKVFRWKGDYYRAIHPGKVDFTRHLLASGFFRELVEQRLIPPTRITDHRLAGFDLVIQAETSPFKGNPANLPPGAARDMALAWIEINRRLAPVGYSLIDGHIGNFAAFGPHMKWIDIGSIQPVPLSMAAVGEFGRCLFFPLLVMGHDPVLRRIGRHLLGHGGLNAAELKALTGLTPHSGETAPLRVLDWMETQLLGLDLGRLETTWGGYTSAEKLAGILAEPADAIPDPRNAAFTRFVTEIAPRKAIDLGSAGGNFTVRLARLGIPCLAVDTDETALALLHDFARARDLPISVRLENVTRLPRQDNVELVSAMALTHHLCLSQMMSFDDVARLFAGMTINALVTEFMPWGLGQYAPSPDPLPDWYRLDGLCEALSRHFRQVETISPDRPGNAPRQMILCRGRLHG